MPEAPGDAGITLTVANRTSGADGVVVLDLRSRTAEPLPSWQPGAHIDLLLPEGLIRQYSLCGDPHDHATYTIAVLREDNGRGGSRFIHDELRAGDEVRIRGPRNQFGLVRSERYTFIAGGIGITPILPMVSAAEAAGADWHLHYGGRHRRSMAFLDALQRWPRSRIHLYPQDEMGLIDLERVIDDARHDPPAHLYCCGPTPLLDAVQAAAGAIASSHLHMERFRPTDVAEGPGRPFDVELVRSGLRLTVPGDTSLLDTLLAAGVDVQYSCESGTCGTCEMTVLKGEVDHRDTLLTAEERDANDTVYPCVSRCKGDLLVLDA
ncbi:MAG: Ferredoxin-NADP reductase [Mycobacterium sp.]|nr:Ferredoxin-NADP reductase [Mycobacterium sp.]